MSTSRSDTPGVPKRLPWRTRNLMKIVKYTDDMLDETHYLPWRYVFSSKDKHEILDVYYQEAIRAVSQLRDGVSTVSTVSTNLDEPIEYAVALIGNRDMFGGGDQPGDVVGYRAHVVFGVAAIERWNAQGASNTVIFTKMIEELEQLRAAV